jgi:hypothetical protein
MRVWGEGKAAEGVREIYVATTVEIIVYGRVRKLGVNYMECTPAYDPLPSGHPHRTIAFPPPSNSLSLSRF